MGKSIRPLHYFPVRTIVAGAPEERFNRQKLTRLFPHQAIRYFLEFASRGIELNDKGYELAYVL